MPDEALPAGLRGDYAAARADFTLRQDPRSYSAADHATWRLLYDRQRALAETHAHPAFVAGLDRLDCAGGVPDLAAAGARLRGLTGCDLVAVPGLIPDGPFFDHLAARRFPVTVWIRRPEELDYLVEPDIFHDFFGHVPLLTDPDFADALAAYGRLGQAVPQAVRPLARLYWHMIEFGLVRHGSGLRAYGAGILSSATETRYCLEDPRPRRLEFDVGRVARSDYFIDDLQPTYFVVPDFSRLFAALAAPELPELLRRAAEADAIPPGAAAPGDIPA
jgi:phenylalanine-4-hydroxylase